MTSNINFDGDTLVIDKENKRVGIKNSSPSSSFDVSGSIQASGDLKLSSSSGISIDGVSGALNQVLSSSGNNSVSWADIQYSVTEADVTAHQAALTITESQISDLQNYSTGNETITLSGDVSGSGATTIAVTITDDSHNHTNSSGDFEVGGDLTVSGNNITMLNQSLPTISLDSSSSGDNWTDQGALIVIGEGASTRNTTALYLTYRGNGLSYIGTGGITEGIPDESYLRFDYNDPEIAIKGNLTPLNDGVYTLGNTSNRFDEVYTDSLEVTDTLSVNTHNVPVVVNTAADLITVNTSMPVYYDGSYWSYDPGLSNTVHTFDEANAIMIGPSDSADGAWIRDVGDGTFNVKWFGAAANAASNANFDSYPAFANAISMIEKSLDYANTSDGFAYLRKWSPILYVPSSADYISGIVTSGTDNRYYLSNNLTITQDNVKIYGDERIIPQLLFGNHTHGIVYDNTSGATQIQYCELKKLRITGVAESANSSVGNDFCSVGVIAHETSRCIFEDLYIDEWVDGWVETAGIKDSGTAGSIQNIHNRIYIQQNYWPNQYNQGPRYGFWSRNDSAKAIISSNASSTSSSGTLEIEVTAHGLSSGDEVDFFDLVGGNGLRPYSHANNFNYISTSRSYFVDVIDANNLEVWKNSGFSSIVPGTAVTSGWITHPDYRTHKIQASKFNDCSVYSQITVKETTFTGDGSTLEYNINVGSGTFGLSKATGIKVFVEEDGIYQLKQQSNNSTLDYKLYDNTSGASNTEIEYDWSAKDGTMATSNNGYNITDVLVVFEPGQAPANSAGIAIMRNDPYGDIAWNVTIGSGNRFQGGELGGYLEGTRVGGEDQFKVDHEADENIFDFDYVQLCDLAFNNNSTSNSAPTSGIAVAKEFSEKHVTKYANNMSGWVLDDTTPTRMFSNKRTSDYTVTSSYANVVTVSVPNNRQGTQRYISGSIDIEFGDASSGDAYVELIVEWREDSSSATWTTLKYMKIQNTVGGGSSSTYKTSVPISVHHDVSVDNNYSVVKNIEYRVTARVDSPGTTNDTATIKGSSATEWSGITVRTLNP